MRYLESDATNPYYNLALEQYAFDVLAAEQDIFMLWRNDNAIIVGRHQNTVAEINAAFVRQNGIRVARRLSGGGAVYHDLGNVNFTCITRADGLGAFDFAFFCRPVLRALAELGVQAELNGRNDMTIDGKKFSGNAQYRKQGRVMHHGTILYASHLDRVSQALAVPKEKIESKGLKSVQSRVVNVKEYMSEKMPVEGFMALLREAMFRAFPMAVYSLTPDDNAAIQRLRHEVYETWDWNYGRSPAYNLTRERRVEGVGAISASLHVDRGTIRDIAFSGDYFGAADTGPLRAALIGCRLERESLSRALEHVDIADYFHHLDATTFLAILTQ